MKTCPDCGREMKPLLIGEFCPNDCDRKRKPPDPFELSPEMFEKPQGSPTFDDWEAAVEEWYQTVFGEESDPAGTD